MSQTIEKQDELYAHVGVLTRRRDHLAQRIVDRRGSESALAHDKEEVAALTAAVEALKDKIDP